MNVYIFPLASESVSSPMYTLFKFIQHPAALPLFLAYQSRPKLTRTPRSSRALVTAVRLSCLQYNTVDHESQHH